MKKVCLIITVLFFTVVGVAQRTAIDAAFDSAVQQGFSGVLLVAKKGKRESTSQIVLRVFVILKLKHPCSLAMCLSWHR